MSSLADIPGAPHAVCADALESREHVFRTATVAKGLSASTLDLAVAAAEVILDVATIACAIRVGPVLYRTLPFGAHIAFSGHTLWTVGLICAVVMILLLDRAGAYSKLNSILRVRETAAVLKVAAQIMAAAFVLWALGHPPVPLSLMVFCTCVLLILLLFQKHSFYLIADRFYLRYYPSRRVLIYGSGDIAKYLLSALRSSPKLGLFPVGLIDTLPSGTGRDSRQRTDQRSHSEGVFHWPFSGALVSDEELDLVLVAEPAVSREQFDEVLASASATSVPISCARLAILPNDPRGRYSEIDQVLLALRATSPNTGIYESIKRTVDLVLSLALLLTAAPALLLIGLLIKLDSHGPILFRQKRVGLHGITFTMFKFRTMYSDVRPYDYSPSAGRDPRITRIGRLLRRSSLDELPQLINVLRGDMSLVGPRPEMPFIVETYTAYQRKRLEVSPGLTGLWQLSRERRYRIHDNLYYDLYYIQNRTVFLDMAVLLHTVPCAMKGI